jgi:SAM-dependent methyltransferase
VAGESDDAVRSSLEGAEIHEGWERRWRSEENERFYERLFDDVIDVVSPPSGTHFLDVGCGPGFHSVRLAKRGFHVHAVDFSPSALAMARSTIERESCEDLVATSREDLLSLSFSDATWDYILCWGVLMHIPDISRGIAELSRVLAPMGYLVVAECTSRSLDALGQRAAMRLRGTPVRKMPAGSEVWKQTPSGLLLARRANVKWLTREFRRNGLVLRKRLPGHLTELYAKLPDRAAASVIHWLNRAWLNLSPIAGPAAGTILIYQKGPAATEE